MLIDHQNTSLLIDAKLIVILLVFSLFIRLNMKIFNMNVILHFIVIEKFSEGI